MQNINDFRKFTEQLKKLYRSHSQSNGKLLFENTYVKPVETLLKIIIKVQEDSLTVNLKKYLYLHPEENAVIFFRVTAAFDANIYYNSFLKTLFEDEKQAVKFFYKVEKLTRETFQ